MFDFRLLHSEKSSRSLIALNAVGGMFTHSSQYIRTKEDCQHHDETKERFRFFVLRTDGSVKAHCFRLKTFENEGGVATR